MKTVYNQSIDQHIDQWTELGIHKKILPLRSFIFNIITLLHYYIYNGYSFLSGNASVGYILERKEKKKEREERGGKDPYAHRTQHLTQKGSQTQKFYFQECIQEKFFIVHEDIYANVHSNIIHF